MILYGHALSSASYRVRIALALKGLQVSSVLLNLRAGEQRLEEFLQINSQGFVPALATDDGVVLTQSVAIIEYLDEIHPEPPLLPKAPVARARVRALAQAIACDVHPLNNLRVLQYLENELQHDKATRETWYRHWVPGRRNRALLSRRCADHGGCVSGASGVQRAALCSGPSPVSTDRRDRRCLPRPARVSGSRAGTPGLSASSEAAAPGRAGAGPRPTMRRSAGP